MGYPTAEVFALLRNIRMVISWFFRWGEHATFAAHIAKFFGVWKMVISTEAGLLAALSEVHKASPFWFGAVGFTVALVIINVVWSLHNKWQTMPNADARDVDRRALIAKARDFVSTTMKQDTGYEYFQHALGSSDIYLKLRPYLKEDFHQSLTSGFEVMVAPRASGMPGIAWAFIDEIERLEKEWNLT